MVDGLLHLFACFSSPFLNPSNQLTFLAFGELKVIIRELSPLLFQLALYDVPIASYFERVHKRNPIDFGLSLLNAPNMGA